MPEQRVPWTMQQIISLREGLTISKPAYPGSHTAVTWFSLGAGTDISPERYDQWAIYLGGSGTAQFALGQQGEERSLYPGGLLAVPAGTLCGVGTPSGAIYTEIIIDREDRIMNEKVTPGRVFELKDLIDYEEGSVVNCDIVKNAGLRYVLMAFDQGTGLQPHRAPGDAIVTAIEGTGVIGYEGEEFELKEGESFRFAKDGLHSVAAREGRFKMSLLLVRE